MINEQNGKNIIDKDEKKTTSFEKTQ